MSIAEERYVDLKDICTKIEPNLFNSLSWILLLNLDLVPKGSLQKNANYLFSYNMMMGKYDDAMKIAQQTVNANRPNSKYYKEMLDIDPKLTKTKEIAKAFFILAKRRIEIAEKLGIRQD
jgi:hypothetical protein